MGEINKEAIAEWVAALRSGTFVQGQGHIETTYLKDDCSGED